MTDSKIIKALECCRKKECSTCPCFDENIECGENLIKHALDLINRQQAEIEREHKIVCDYAQAARTIGLYLREFCDKKLPYDEMIADAARKASAEIERLQKAGEDSVSCFTRMETLYKIKCKELEVVKTEAIKEFAERLKRWGQYSDDFNCYAVAVPEIDNLVKEMTEVSE